MVINDLLIHCQKKTVIIDDTPLVYANSIDNAIPILSWEDDPSDKEVECSISFISQLFILIPFLQELAKADDVTELIRNRYHLQDLLLNRSINQTVFIKHMNPNTNL